VTGSKGKLFENLCLIGNKISIELERYIHKIMCTGTATLYILEHMYMKEKGFWEMLVSKIEKKQKLSEFVGF